jgi:hypothetical protein
MNELLVDTPNPEALDQTLQGLGAVLVGGPDFVRVDGHYVVRALGDVGFVKFACEAQGYCTVVDGPGRWTEV